MNADTDFSAGLSYALAYAAMGIPVLPLMPGKKTPHGNLAPRGFKDATTSVATLRHWWGACPGAGIGIYPGPAGLLVIDVDVKGAAVGLATLERLQSTYGPLPSTLTQRTPSGGWHYVFQAPFQAGNGHKLGPGIDVRGGSGYIVVEPTIIDGNAYRWIDWEVTSGRAPAVALLPSWMEPLLLLKDAKPVLGNLETVVAKSDTYVSPETLSDLRLALMAADNYLER